MSGLANVMKPLEFIVFRGYVRKQFGIFVLLGKPEKKQFYGFLFYFPRPFLKMSNICVNTTFQFYQVQTNRSRSRVKIITIVRFRFQHPKPIKNWKGVLNVTGKPNSCVQTEGIAFPGHPGRTFGYSLFHGRFVVFLKSLLICYFRLG